MIIALTGYPRCGKDALPNYLRNKFPNKDIRSVAFADYLKQVHMLRLGITVLDDYNDLLHSGAPYKGVDLRTQLAELGNKLKARDPLIFVKEVNDYVHRATREQADHIIITDLRYPEEYSYITRHKYPIVRIVRDSTDALADKTAPWNKHIESFKTNYVLDNNGTLAEYFSTIDDANILC